MASLLSCNNAGREGTTWRRQRPRGPGSTQNQHKRLPGNRHDIRLGDISDALSIWTTDRQAGRFLRPASIYTDAGHHDDGTPRITDGRLTAERQTATRFGRDRRAPFISSPGPPMPYACQADPLPA